MIMEIRFFKSLYKQLWTLGEHLWAMIDDEFVVEFWIAYFFFPQIIWSQLEEQILDNKLLENQP